jgi:MFS family permease
VLALTAVPGVVSIACVAFGVREDPAPEVSSKPAAKLSLHGPVPPAMRPLLALVAVFTLANASDSFLILRAKELGVPTVWLPIAWASLSLVRALAATPGGWIADRIGRARALSLGWALYAVAYAGFGFARSLPVAGLSLLIYGLYYGLTEGTERAMVSSLVRDDELGRAFGYFNLVTGLMALPASALFGWLLPVHHGLWAWGGSAALAALSALGMARWSGQLQSERQFSRPER